MMLNGGELDGMRLLGRKTVELMTANHLPGGQDLRSWPGRARSRRRAYAGVGFGLGFSVMQSPARAHIPGSRRATPGAARPAPRSGSIRRRSSSSIFMTQLMPSSSYPLTRELRVLSYASLID